MSNFYKVIRSGPTNVQVKFFPDRTVKPVKKTSVALVSFSERQCAIRLIKDNFPKTLLWDHNQFHRKQSHTKYMFHTCQTTNKVKKTVRFNPISIFVDLGYLINLENDFYHGMMIFLSNK